MGYIPYDCYLIPPGIIAWMGSKRHVLQARMESQLLFAFLLARAFALQASIAL